MKFRFSNFSLTLAFLCILFISCSNNRLVEQSTRGEFIEHLQRISPEQRQGELQRLQKELSAALDKAEDFGVYFGMSLSLSSGNEEATNWETADWDSLDIKEADITLEPIDKVRPRFDDYVAQTYGVQTRQLPNSKFSVESGSDAALDPHRVDENILQYFKGAETMTADKVGLTLMDSLEVEFSYTHPLSLDTLVIRQGMDSVVFQGRTIHLYELTAQQIELRIPIDLFAKFYGHLGITPNDKFITSGNSYSFPSWGLAPSITVNAHKVLDLLDLYAAQPLSDDDLKRLESALSDEVYLDINKVAEFNVDADIIDKLLDADDDTSETIDKVRKVMGKETALFAPTEQIISIKYPYLVKEIRFFFTNEVANFSARKIVPVDRSLVNGYDVIYDEATSAYGIVDSVGRIVVKPQYKQLTRQADRLYYDYDTDATYRLDAAKKKLRRSSINYLFMRELNDKLYVFADDNMKCGLLNHDLEVVFPFEYNFTNQYGDLFVGTQQSEVIGGSFYSLYLSDGRQIELPQIDYLESDKLTPGLILTDQDYRTAFITYQGDLIVPFREQDLWFLGSAKVIEMKRNDRRYFVDMQGNEILLPENVDRIWGPKDVPADGRLAFNDENADKWGWLNEQGQIIVPPHYDLVYACSQGISLVMLKYPDLRHVLVDDEGKIVKDFGHNADVKVRKQPQGEMYYVLGETVYNWKGNKTDLKPSDVE